MECFANFNGYMFTAVEALEVEIELKYIGMFIDMIGICSCLSRINLIFLGVSLKVYPKIHWLVFSCMVPIV